MSALDHLAPPETVQRMAEDVRDTNCPGCPACKERANAVAAALLALFELRAGWVGDGAPPHYGEFDRGVGAAYRDVVRSFDEAVRDA